MKTDMTVAGYLIYKEKVLLIHHKKLNLWLPVGGHMEQNETPDDALRREFKEEVNLEIKILNESDIPFKGNIKRNLATPFYSNVHNVGDHDHSCLFYVCTADDIDGLEANLDELKDLAWFSKEDLNQSHVPIDVRNIALKAFQIYHSL